MKDATLDLVVELIGVAAIVVLMFVIADAEATTKEQREARRANERQYEACVATCSMTCPATKEVWR